MKKILPMRDPIISSFPIYGDLFSIIDESENAKNWMCNNFIQMNYVEPVVFFESYRSIFYNCPHLSSCNVTRAMIDKCWNNDFPMLIKRMIDADCYIFLYVNRKYVKQYECPVDVTHELFIFGYDEEENVFYCADNRSSGKYTHFTCPIPEMEEAYWKGEDNNYCSALHCINVIKTPPANNWFESINWVQIHELFSAYAESRITVNVGERYFVKKSGFALQEDTAANLVTPSGNIDWRAFCVFHDHKKLMVFRLQYLGEIYSTEDFAKYLTIYRELESEYELIVALMVKYNVSHSDKTLNKIREHLDDALKKEKNILVDLKNLFGDYLQRE